MNTTTEQLRVLLQEDPEMLKQMEHCCRGTFAAKVMNQAVKERPAELLAALKDKSAYNSILWVGLARSSTSEPLKEDRVIAQLQRIQANPSGAANGALYKALQDEAKCEEVSAALASGTAPELLGVPTEIVEVVPVRRKAPEPTETQSRLTTLLNERFPQPAWMSFGNPLLPPK